MTHNVLMTIAEVARETAHSPKTIRSWIRSGKLKAIRVGHRYLIRRSDYLACLRQHVFRNIQ